MTTPPAFDPRLVPVLGADSHLLPVQADRWQARALQQRFIAMPNWTPEFREEPKFSDRSPSAAAVLVPLVVRDQTTVLLTQRTTHLSSHSGQIAFPGGKVDADDRDAIAAALREAHEEIGLDARFVEILGTLPTYTTGSAYVVTPVIALVREGFVIQPNADEVADVFEVPLAFLMNPANHHHHALQWAGARREWLSMPYVDAAGERFIWGATAGMLRNFYQFLSASLPEL